MGAATWRSLIQRLMPELWPDLIHGAWWIEGQVQAECAGNPLAVSPTGARGLMQLEPSTAHELGVEDLDDPEQSLRGGVRYLREIYLSLSDVPVKADRLFWSFAGYNAGPAFVRKAVALALADEPLHGWAWLTGRHYLFHWRNVAVEQGRPPIHCDHLRVWWYVGAIAAYVRETFRE